MKNLSINDLQQINGGCASCREKGKKLGKILRNALFVDEISDAWNDLWK